ncbi:MarR family winged helix-turn-helix transcriptional regulator [Candidatus Parvarchaeota archaeon]|nr:MarR family winged helix-turn-helix transcriptional regulator [Candidatus Parvarchaeota archaeon]
MVDQDMKNPVKKMFFHKKPFLLLSIINDNDGKMYPASISKKIDCSYAYIVKLLKMMNNIGLISYEGTNHKRIIRLTLKGKKVFKALSSV